MNGQGSHETVCFLEPYAFVEFVVRGPRPLLFSIELPRNLNKTRLGFVHGEEDSIEGVTGCLDLDAILFVRSPVLRAKQGGVSTKRDFGTGCNV